MEEQSSSSGAAPTPAPKSKALWIVVAVIVVVVVVLAAAVLGGLFTPAAKPALRIGTLLSITGALSQYGPGGRCRFSASVSTSVASTLASGMSALTGRMTAQDVMRSAQALLQRMKNTTDYRVLGTVSPGLAGLAVQLEPREAAAAVEQAAQQRRLSRAGRADERNRLVPDLEPEV